MKNNHTGEEHKHQYWFWEHSAPGSPAGNGKAVKVLAFCPLITVYLRAFFVPGKGFPGRFRIAINLPATGTLAAVGAFFDEAVNIFCRIPQKQTDLMGEILLTAELSPQLLHALLAVSHAIALLLKNLGCNFVGQILLQPGGA